MSTVAYINDFRVTVGGTPHSGWLPAGAAAPFPTPKYEISLNLAIVSEADGYLLITESSDGSVNHDTWHRSVADAQEQAQIQYGVPSTAWHQAGNGVRDEL